MQELKELLSQSLGFIIEEGVILALIIALNFFLRSLINRVHAQINLRQGEVLHESFQVKLLKPLRYMITFVGAGYMLYAFIVRLEMQNNFQVSFRQFRNLVIIFCSAWLILEIKNQVKHSYVKRRVHEKKKVDQTKVDVVAKLSTIALFILTSLIILDTLGVHISALIAFGGVGGIALGFAAKDVVANFFSGIMIYVTRPFSVGHRICALDNSYEGEVEHIGYYMTKVRLLDKRPLYVPNALFSSKMIVNATRMSHRRIKHVIGIRYQDFSLLESILEEILKLIKNHPKLDQNLLCTAEFQEYGAYSLNILIIGFTKETLLKDFLEIQEGILIEVGQIIEKNGAQIAFPTTTLDLPDGKAGVPQK
jgi:MscS family membrane protein